MAANDLFRWECCLKSAVERRVSDLHLAAGQRVWERLDGRMVPLDGRILTSDDVWAVLLTMTNEVQRERLERERSLDISWEAEGARFRVNIYYQRGNPALALRLLPFVIPTPDEIGMPRALRRLIAAENGLILVCGRTGSGKTTTLASFLAAAAETSRHILTLEDPVEFLLPAERSLISQREWGKDFFSFPRALREALREMPDMILVGEIRDAETMATALAAAEAGVLVLGTLHSRSAAEAALRVEGLFPAGQRDSVRDQFAAVLTGIVAQKLVSKVDGGRTAVSEVLLPVPAVRSLIRQGKYSQLAGTMLSHARIGMQTASMAAKDLWHRGVISEDVYRDLEREEGGGNGYGVISVSGAQSSGGVVYGNR